MQRLGGIAVIHTFEAHIPTVLECAGGGHGVGVQCVRSGFARVENLAGCETGMRVVRIQFHGDLALESLSLANTTDPQQLLGLLRVWHAVRVHVHLRTSMMSTRTL